MLPTNLRFNARFYPNFFKLARNWRLNGLLAKVAPVSQTTTHTAWQHNSLATDQLPSPDISVRWSVVVGKRHGNAVQRAKIKRQLRHAIVSLWQEEPELFSLPYVVMLVVSQPAEQFSDYHPVLRQLLVKLHASDRI